MRSEQRFEFRQGPIFSSLVLVDEINRASPKTQAALLEAMQEGQVTYAGVNYPLPKPFWVLATQNPIELEGTYPLPEAQLDRFLCKITIDYPSRSALMSMLNQPLEGDVATRVEAVISSHRIEEMMLQAREVVIAEPVKQAALDLVLSTNPKREGASATVRDHVRYGASPRALQSLLRAARVRALAEGRGQVAYEDIKASALPTLRHRILLNIESELDSVDVDAVLENIANEWMGTADRTTARLTQRRRIVSIRAGCRSLSGGSPDLFRRRLAAQDPRRRGPGVSRLSGLRARGRRA